MADRHTAQTVIEALRARGRTVTDVDTAANTTALVDGVRLEFSRTRCKIDDWTRVDLGTCSPRGRTVDQINEEITAALARAERRRQNIAAEAEWNRRVALSASLSSRLVSVRARPEDGAASAARDKLRDPPPLDAAQEQRFLAAAMAARRT